MRQPHDLATILRSCGARRDLLQGRRIHNEILASEHWPGPSNFLANHLVLMYGKCGSIDEAHHVFTGIAQPDLFSWNMMLSAFAQNGHSQRAKDLFDGIPKRNVVSWNIIVKLFVENSSSCEAELCVSKMPSYNANSWNVIVSAFALTGHLQIAVDFFDKMKCCTEETLEASTAIITSSGRCGSADLANRVFDSMPRRDIVAWTALLSANRQSLDSSRSIFAAMPQWNVVCSTTMIQILSRDGKLDQARELFDQMPESNIVAWTAIIQAHVQSDQIHRAKHLFDRLPFPPDSMISILLISSLSHHGSTSIVDLIAIFDRCSIPRDARIWETLLAATSQLGLVEESNRIFSIMPQHSAASCTTVLPAQTDTNSSKLVFDRMQHRDAISYNAMIQIFVRERKLDDACGIFHSMPACDACSWSIILQAYAQTGQMSKAREVFDCMPERSIVCYSTLLQGYVSSDQIDLAKNAFERMPEHDLVSSTSMISALGRSPRTLDQARDLFESLAEKDDACWNAMVFAFAKNGLVDEASRLFARAGSSGNTVLCNEMIAAYSGAGLIDKSLEAFDVTERRDFVSWNSILRCYCENDRVDRARQIFELMPQRNDVSITTMMCASGVEESERLFASLSEGDENVIASTAMVAVYAESGHLQEAKELFDSISKPTSVSCITIITAYAKHGLVMQATDLFQNMPERDPKLWNATIAALSHNGCSREAVDLYKLFQLEGLEADEVTMLSLLSACSRAGLLAEGYDLFSSMQADDRLRKLLLPEHYSCMVDLLSRTGNLPEAGDLIEQMPLSASPSAWNALLAACATQSDKLTGVAAARQAMDRRPGVRSSSSPYVVLANIQCNS